MSERFIRKLKLNDKITCNGTHLKINDTVETGNIVTDVISRGATATIPGGDTFLYLRGSFNNWEELDKLFNIVDVSLIARGKQQEVEMRVKHK